MSKKLKLATSPFSPYGHRVEMVLIEKDISFERVEVNLQNRPAWFVKDAPLGKVPLLYVEDEVLFESIAICEYLESAFPKNPLHSKDLVTKSQHRAWMEFSNAIMSTSFSVIFAQNQQEFDAAKAHLMGKLEILEKYLKFNPYFEGEKFSLVDICFASAFKPLTFIDNKFTLEIFDSYKNVATYVEGVITRNSLSRALPQNYEEIFKAFLTRKNSHLLTMSFTL
jgi:glutathione S-transferase